MIAKINRYEKVLKRNNAVRTRNKYRLLLNKEKTYVNKGYYAVFEEIFKTLFNNNNYHELESLIIYMNYNAYDLKRLKNFLNIYKHWNKFEYDKIKIVKYNNYPEILEPLIKQFENNIEAIKILRKEKPKELMLILDLINKSKRCDIKGEYNESILYLYRSLELITQKRLRTKYGIHSENVDINKLRKYGINDQEINKYYKYNRSNISKLTLYSQFNLLYSLNDSIGEYYQGNIHDFQDIMNLRHSSLLTHGTSTITHVQYEKFTEIINETLRLFDEDSNKLLKMTEFPKYELDDNNKSV